MARTTINQQIGSATSYTVPPGKQAVIRAFRGSSNTSVLVNSVSMVSFGTDTTDATFGPFALDAGDVVSVSNAGGGEGVFAISGFVYDK